MALVHPVGEEKGGLRRVHDLPDVSAGIGEAERDNGVVEHLLDGTQRLVQEWQVEDGQPVGLIRDLQERFNHRHTTAMGVSGQCVVSEAVVARCSGQQNIRTRSIEG